MVELVPSKISGFSGKNTVKLTVGLDISMLNTLGMEILQTLEHLQCVHHHDLLVLDTAVLQ
jgi:hypothetical protein